MDHRTSHVVVALALLAIGSGCGGSLGPLVTDVHYGNGGELIVTRCMLDISGAGSMTTYSMRDCERATHPPPRPVVRATAPVPASPAANDGATVAH